MRPLMELMFTIRPRSDRRRSGRNACVTATCPKTFTSNCLLRSATSRNSRGPLTAMPALFTRPSSTPPLECGGHRVGRGANRFGALDVEQHGRGAGKAFRVLYPSHGREYAKPTGKEIEGGRSADAGRSSRDEDSARGWSGHFPRMIRGRYNPRQIRGGEIVERNLFLPVALDLVIGCRGLPSRRAASFLAGAAPAPRRSRKSRRLHRDVSR